MNQPRLLFLAALFISSSALAARSELPALNIDPRAITVSGLSSGGFMAVQLDVAYSSLFSGAATFAGGIYACAEGQVSTAQTLCTASPDQQDVSHFVKLARSSETSGAIDGLKNLASHQIYIFNGTQDITVRPGAAIKLRDFYAAFTKSDNILLKNDLPAGHGQPTVDYGNACGFGFSPWILKCGYEGSGSALSHLYGSLKPKSQAAPGHFVEFDQALYAGADALMGEKGYAYVPEECADAKTVCRLHVALHGCQQSNDTLGDVYRMHAGYNEWAESNRIVVLYPSARKSTDNPNACWDWWGYADRGYATKSGKQIQAIRKMIARLSGV